MCGIDGFFSEVDTVDSKHFYDAHLLLAHRGPDDEGFLVGSLDDVLQCRGDDTIADRANLPHICDVGHARVILGHRRLSVLDLTASGHQPMLSHDGRYAIVYNGEVFNYRELRQELRSYGYEFLGTSDTEVVLAAFQEWGTDSFSRFNGMWALAIWDMRENRLILSRDRFGIKPLYYSVKKGAIVFASEMKFIMELVEDSFDPNPDAAAEYVDWARVSHSQQTFWKDIEELEPGCFAVYMSGSIILRRYWNFEPSLEKWTTDEAVERFAEIFTDSLKLRMRSDVEVGSLLSGGLDSSLIVCELDRLGLIGTAPFQSFSAVFDEERFSEQRFAAQVVERTGIIPHYVTPTPKGLLDELDELLWHIEEPFRSASVYSQNLLYRRVRSASDVIVLLNGQGGDELFGGYTHHYYHFITQLIATGRWIAALREILMFTRQRNVSLRRVASITRSELPSAKGAGDGYFNAVTFRELRESALREYLKYDDRNSMAYSLEARVPFMDYRLVEFAFSLPVDLKIRKSENKRLVREYARGRVPEGVRSRKDKMGFVSPQELWQRQELLDEFRNLYRKVEEKRTSDLVLQFVDKDRLYRYVVGSTNDWAYAWRVFCLDRWCEVSGIS